MESTFDLKCSFKKEAPSGLGKKSRYRTTLYSKNAVKYLDKYNVKFKEGNWTVPNKIKKSNKGIKKEYVAGFVDSQGSVGDRKILSYSKNTKGLVEIEDLMKSIGLRVRLIGPKLSIYSKDSLEMYPKNIGFSIKRKQIKLFNLVNGYKRSYTTSEEANRLIPEIKKHLNKGFSQRKTAKMLNISTTIIKNRMKLLGGLI